MRIALVSREYPPFFGGGIGTYARHIAPALAEAGCRVHVVTQTYDLTHPRCEARGRLWVHRAPTAGDPAGWTAAVLRFAGIAGRMVAELAERGEIEVAEFAECEGAGSAIAMMRAAGARRLGTPIVVHLHTPTEMLYQLRSIHDREVSPGLAAYFLAERAEILMADVVCAPSRFIAEWATRHYGLPETPTVIPYAIEGLPREHPAASEGSRHKRVLYLGRIEPRKGVEPLIRAWARVSRERPGWTLRLVGADTSTGANNESMRGRLSGLLPPEAAKSVEFVDALPPAMLAAEFSAASVCIVPSLWENFPNTCIEAMAHARPVIVSDEGGMAEMIEGTDAGITFRSGDVDDLANGLVRMLGESPAQLTARGRAGRARIGRLCDKRAVVSARLRLYQAAVERGRARSARDRAGLRLRLWRQMQDAATGRLDRMCMPELPARIGQFLREEAAA